FVASSYSSCISSSVFSIYFFFSWLRSSPTSTPFPYPTLFRSLPAAQLPRRGVADEVQLSDRPLHLRLGALGDALWPVQHVGHRAHGDAGSLRDVGHAGPADCRGLVRHGAPVTRSGWAFA